MKILVVDDESLIRYSLVMTFKDGHTDIRTAASGKEAIAAIRQTAFDVCFLDLHLPDMSGMDIMKVLRTDSPGTRIIVISGEYLSPETEKIIRENAVLFLEKPFDLDQVKAFVSLINDQLTAASNGMDLNEGDGAVSDRRRHARAASDRLILCTAFTPPSEACATDLEAWLRDVSSSGMGISVDYALAPGCRVRLFDGMMMKEGTVRWSRATSRQGVYNIGVQFTSSA